MKCQKTLEEDSRNMEIATRQIAEDEKKLEAIVFREKEVRAAYNSAKNNRDSLDCAKAIADAEEFFQKAQEEKELLKMEKKDGRSTVLQPLRTDASAHPHLNISMCGRPHSFLKERICLLAMAFSVLAT